ncbi:hypothetical protein PsYK624_003720 [Phanerochaete sordida]|uniref:Uncharacterized protein n=1 Tax=Phanerochaete sordida TaxID=48140 RepID=A0A9P3L6R3_9APHY|nr:hypothetical protein PsYK624_003720 [Phanerochaete sordida]
MSAAPGEATAIREALAVSLSIDYVSSVALTVVVYEMVFNIDREMSVIRRKFNKRTYSSILLIVIRSATAVCSFFAWANHPASRCKSTIIISQIAYIIMVIAISAFTALRVYALTIPSKYSLLVAGLVFILSVGPQSMTVVAFVSAKYTYIGAPFYQCSQTLTFSSRLTTMRMYSTSSQFSNLPLMPAVPWISDACVLTGNVVTLLVTWIRTFALWCQHRRLGLHNSSITGQLLRDGTVYFIIITALGIAQTVFLMPQPGARLGGTYVQPLFQIAPAIIVCRFILNLQEPTAVEKSSLSAIFRTCPVTTTVSRMLRNGAEDIGGSVGWADRDELQRSEHGSEKGVQLASLPSDASGPAIGLGHVSA